MTHEFTRDWLVDEALEAPIKDTIVGHGRWSVTHELVFKHEGLYYRTYYRVGATESQEELPWEGQTTVKCEQVEAREVTTTEWVPV